MGKVAPWNHAAEIAPAAGRELSAETWARACFQYAALPLRTVLIAGWRLLLLHGPSRSDSDLILGWRIAERRHERVLLRRGSALGIDAELVFTVAPHRVRLTTALVFRRRVARVVWILVGPVHIALVRLLLARARRSLRTGPNPGSS